MNSLCPIHPHHSPDLHPTGRCQRRGRAARRRGCSRGQCGGSSWHSERITFQHASVVVRSQTSQGQVSGPALIYSATTPKSVKIRTQHAADQREVAQSRMQTPAVRLTPRISAAWETHTILNNSPPREKQFLETHAIDFFSRITQIL